MKKKTAPGKRTININFVLEYSERTIRRQINLRGFNDREISIEEWLRIEEAFVLKALKKKVLEHSIAKISKPKTAKSKKTAKLDKGRRV